jgi:hypothetical protein
MWVAHNANGLTAGDRAADGPPSGQQRIGSWIASSSAVMVLGAWRDALGYGRSELC